MAGAAGNSSIILQKGKGGMRMVRDDGKRSYFELDEPEWKPDKNVLVCSTCGDKFSFMVRKHHCRRSGIVLCDRCCIKVPLERFAYMDPVRVCAWWKDQCEYESEFFKLSLPVMRRGAVFTLEHDGKQYPNIRVKLSDTDTALTFRSASDDKPWPVAAELPVNTIHMTDDKHLVITNKKIGRIVFQSADKDVSKRWRKSIKRMIKVLHGKPRRVIPKEFSFMHPVAVEQSGSDSA
eukprot:m.168744 g.168744  ORF g.168744 m.168744 type:complete len:235 (-) comp12995_c0_seq1:260-964(-)